jgi:hypothetical protein
VEATPVAVSAAQFAEVAV